MKYLILIITLTLGAVAHAGTLEQKLAELNDAQLHPEIVTAFQYESPKSIQGYGIRGNVHTTIITWFYRDGGVLKKASAEMIILDLGDPAKEEALWLNDVPAIDKPPVEEQPDPLGTDDDIIGALGVKVVKAQVERGKPGEAVVTAYELVGADAVPGKWIVHVDDKGATVVTKEKSAADVKAEAGAVAIGAQAKLGSRNVITTEPAIAYLPRGIAHD